MLGRHMMTTSEKQEIERLAEALAQVTGESPVEVLLRALDEDDLERRRRLADGFRIKQELERRLREALATGQARSPQASDQTLRAARLRRFLEKEVWPSIPPSLRGTTISKAEREEILGYGPEGV
jgi:hypothetical protein